MCGLTALVSRRGEASLAAALAMTDVVQHRGPDSEGYCIVGAQGTQRFAGPDTISFSGFADVPSAPTSRADSADPTVGWAALGHRRLSIQDLSANGHQPMTDSHGENWLVFNGEIYNFVELRNELRANGHTFRSGSDTEVILAAYREWGSDFLRRLVGIFALVIVDARRRSLLAARDHFGVKPLYVYSPDPDTVAFASEIKQYAALPQWQPRVNGPMLYDFLNFNQHNHTTQTMFAGVRQVGPGSCIEIRLDEWTSEPQDRRWWQLTPRPFDGSFDEAAGEFGRLFREAVTLQLRSDVPVGSCLSGGLDSSSIVCCANDTLREGGEGSFSQLAFSATSDDPAVDESVWSAMVADKTGVALHTRTPDMAAVPQLLDRLAWHLDEPFGSTSILAQWTVFGLAAERRIKVMLDGQGADEQLAGYTYFFAWRFQELLRAGRLPELYREVRSTRFRHPGLMGGLAQFTASLMLPQSLARLGGRLARTPTQDPDAWLNRAHLGVAGFPDPNREHGARGPSVHALSVAQLTRTNLPRLLQYEDRNSMAHSVEARVPFLDHRLVEFAVGLPSDYLISDGVTKRVLRASMTGTLPEPIRARMDKIGFQTAEERWMRHDDPATALSLADVAVDASTGFLTDGTRRRARQIVAGERPFDAWLWRIISTGAWIRRFGVSV